MMIMMTCGLLRLPDSSDFNSPGTQGYKLTTTINLCNRTIVILINKSWFEYVGVQFQSADFFFLGGVRFPALTFQQGASISSIFQTESLMFIEIYHQLSAVALMHSRWKKLGRSACWGLLNPRAAGESVTSSFGGGMVPWSPNSKSFLIPTDPSPSWEGS